MARFLGQPPPFQDADSCPFDPDQAVPLHPPEGPGESFADRAQVSGQLELFDGKRDVERGSAGHRARRNRASLSRTVRRLSASIRSLSWRHFLARREMKNSAAAALFRMVRRTARRSKKSASVSRAALAKAGNSPKEGRSPRRRTPPGGGARSRSRARRHSSGKPGPRRPRRRKSPGPPLGPGRERRFWRISSLFPGRRSWGRGRRSRSFLRATI